MPKSITTFKPFDFHNQFVELGSEGRASIESTDDFLIYSLQDKELRLSLPFPPHRKTVHDFILVTRGQAQRTLGIKLFDVFQSELMWIPQLQISTTTFFSRDLEGFYCHFSDEFLASTTLLADNLLGSEDYGKIAVPPDVLTRLNTLLTLTNTLYKASWKQNKNLIAQYLRTIVTEINNLAAEKAKGVNSRIQQDLTTRYVQLVNSNISNGLHIRDYADMLHVTPNHLNKMVKMRMGLSAQAVYNKIILQEAKVLLLQTTMDISEIAYTLGFGDVSYFGKFFKKLTQNTPLQYRKMIGIYHSRSETY